MLVSFVPCLTYVGIAHVQEDSFNGTWKVDLDKSSGEALSTAELVILEGSNNIEHGTTNIKFADGASTSNWAWINSEKSNNCRYLITYRRSGS